jgi:mono/diheme cytochrome c family protein
MRLVLGIVVAAALSLCSVPGVRAQAGSAPSQDPVAGSRVFQAKGCVKCHSINGVGGKVGPDLAKTARPHSFTEVATAMWNHLPRMAEKMKALGIDRPALDDQQARDLLAFLYTLHYFDPPGNRENGRKVFVAKHCVECHQVAGQGGTVGPSLDSLHEFTSPMYVAAAMWNHGPQMAEKMKEKGVERPTFTAQELRDLIAYVAPATAGPQTGPIYALPGNAESGRMLFAEKKCVECHSAGGAGGKVGPELVDLGVRRSPLEFAAAIWNKAPKMMLAMQQRSVPAPKLTAEEMADIVAYLYSVRYFASGNISNGWRVLSEKGCLQCHAVFGERGKPASDIAKAKGLDSPSAVVAMLWNHTLATPTVAGAKTPWPVFQPKEMADMIALLQSLGRRESSTPR